MSRSNTQDRLRITPPQSDNKRVSEPRFHVFLDGAIDNTSDGIEEIVSAIANRYGLSGADLKSRLFQGKVRVKANVDRATAEQFAKDLAALGAIASVTPAPDAAAATNVSPTSRPSSSAMTSGLSAASSTATSAAKPTGSGFQSGLSAAFTPTTDDAASFAALEGNDAMLSLSALDGRLDGSASSPSSARGAAKFGPPPDDDMLTLQDVAPPPSARHSGTMNTASTAANNASGSGASLPTASRFAPPSEASEVEVTLADDFVPRKAREPSLAEKSIAATSAAAALATAAATPQPRRGLREHFARWRVRFAVGIVVAIVVGLVPAMIVHAMRESSAFSEIDRNVARLHAQAETYEAWESLDPMRASQLERKRSARRNATALAMVVWGLAGAGVAYVWFRRVPWQRLVGADTHDATATG